MNRAEDPPAVVFDDLPVAWDALVRLTENLPSSDEPHRVVDACLDVVLRATGADRAMVLVQAEEGVLVPIGSRAKGRDLDPAEKMEVSRTVARRAVDDCRVVVHRPLDEADATESMLFLGIHLAMAAPMRSVAVRSTGSEIHGALYVDFRNPRARTSPLAEALLSSAANVLGAVLAPYRRLERAREDLREAAIREPERAPSLEELLAPRSMTELRREVATCLRSDAPVLVLGESGTGKTYLARALAEASGRTPIVRAVLGSSDDLNTVTSELFGHERGSFSGALQKRTGLVEYAHGGTLIFDEILNLPARAQQLLLDFTQFGTYRPLGWERREPKHATTRLIAATNGDLDDAIAKGRFRQDLYYRMAHAVLVLPPLRERREDIPALAEAILRRVDPRRAWALAAPLRRALMDPKLSWRGNVRELEAVIGRARDRALLEDPSAKTLRVEHLTVRDAAAEPAQRPPAPGSAAQPKVAPHTGAFKERMNALAQQRTDLDDKERDLVAAALERHAGVVAYAARELGIPRTSLSSRIDALGLTKRGRRKS